MQGDGSNNNDDKNNSHSKLHAKKKEREKWQWQDIFILTNSFLFSFLFSEKVKDDGLRSPLSLSLWATVVAFVATVMIDPKSGVLLLLLLLLLLR